MMVSIGEYVEMTTLRHQGGPFVKTLNSVEFGEYLRLEAEQWKAIVVGIAGDSVRIERHVEMLQHVAGQVTDQNLDVLKSLYLATRALAVEAVNSAIGMADSYKSKNARKRRAKVVVTVRRVIGFGGPSTLAQSRSTEKILVRS